MPDGRLGAGVRLALTTFTVTPLRPGRVDRSVAAVAMALAPVIGAGIGAAAVGAGAALHALGASTLLGAAVGVTLAVVSTRGLHLDGLADTADGLGSYRDAESALAIMRKPDVGAFGVAAVVLSLMIQTAALSTVLTRPLPAALCAGAAALAGGRLAATLACRRGMPAARESGLGALVVGVVGWPAMLAGSMLVAALAVPAVPDRPWLGPVAAAAAVLVAVLLTRHAVRRLGGVTGDVLGANVECATTIALVGMALG